MAMAVRLSDVDAICLENGETLLGWLQKFSYSSPKKIEISKNTNESFDIVLYTDNHIYRIVATKTYLGCTAATRKPRPGEKWNRGNDLPDGKFNAETFHKILGAIIFYEAKDVVKDRVYEPMDEEVKLPKPEDSLEIADEKVAELIKFGKSDLELRKPVVK
jgi:hypothetical protein